MLRSYVAADPEITEQHPDPNTSPDNRKRLYDRNLVACNDNALPNTAHLPIGICPDPGVEPVPRH
jgi:hypothetical protein